MTIKTTDLLELLTKAGELDLSVFVRKDEDGDYVVKFYELYSNEFDEKIIINKDGISCGMGGTYSFDGMMSVFDGKLRQKDEERIKRQKRQELIARLTDEEKELLGLSSSQSVPHKSQMPF